jgi:hypothetical protein
MYRFATYLISIVATVVLLIACDGDVIASNPEDQRVRITLVHPNEGADSIDLLVPVAFIGPSGLPTATENRQGGKYEKLLVQFSYPSMTPPADAAALGSAMEVYAEVYAAMRGATRSFAEGGLSRRKAAYDQSDGKICQLQEYKSKTMLGQTDQKFHAWIYYYYRDPTEAVDDVYVHCMDIAMDGDPKCTHYFETEGGLQVVLNLVPRSQLCQWSEISMHVGEFLDGFIVTE